MTVPSYVTGILHRVESPGVIDGRRETSTHTLFDLILSFQPSFVLFPFIACIFILIYF